MEDNVSSLEAVAQASQKAEDARKRLEETLNTLAATADLIENDGFDDDDDEAELDEEAELQSESRKRPLEADVALDAVPAMAIPGQQPGFNMAAAIASSPGPMQREALPVASVALAREALKIAEKKPVIGPPGHRKVSVPAAFLAIRDKNLAEQNAASIYAYIAAQGALVPSVTVPGEFLQNGVLDSTAGEDEANNEEIEMGSFVEGSIVPTIDVQNSGIQQAVIIDDARDAAAAAAAAAERTAAAAAVAAAAVASSNGVSSVTTGNLPTGATIRPPKESVDDALSAALGIGSAGLGGVGALHGVGSMGVGALGDVGPMDQTAVMQAAIINLAPEQSLTPVDGAAAILNPEGDDAGDFSEMTAEQQQAALVAQQQILMQQYQFQEQARLYEEQRARQNLERIEQLTSNDRNHKGDRWMPMQLCKQFARGHCQYGDQCIHAHDPAHLHPFSPDNPSNVRAKEDAAVSGSTNLLEEQDKPAPLKPVMRMQRRQSMCQRFEREGCLLNEKCPYAHKPDDLGTMGHAYVSPVKSILCAKWLQKGECIYGKHCMRAHDMSEIGTPKPDYLVKPGARAKPKDD